MLDPSLHKDPRGRKRKAAITVEAAKQETKRQAGEDRIVLLSQAMAEAETGERQHWLATRAVQRNKEKRTQLGIQETRGKGGRTAKHLTKQDAIVPAGVKERRERQIRQQLGTAKREDLTPGKRKKLTELIDSKTKIGEARLGLAFWNRMHKETGVSVHNLKQLVTPQGREVTAAKLSVVRRGKGRYWRMVVQSRSQGQRATRPDTLGGIHRPEKDKVREWLQKEESFGHTPNALDLLDQFQLELEDLIFNLEKEEPAWTAILDKLDSDEALEEGFADQVEAAAAGRERLSSARLLISRGFASKQNRGYHKQQLLCFTEKVERKPDLIFPMTEAVDSSQI